MRQRRFDLAALVAFIVLAVVLTYPQIRLFTTAIAEHPDPYFSIWRLAWVAHQLRADPAHLFDTNIFYPERGTAAYSDAMLLPATVLSPLFWLRMNPISIYNGALLGALALSGFTMFLLCRTLTGDRVAAFAGGVVYAFAPYRFEQYIHLEMQMVFWIPLAALAVHRLLAGRRVRDGLALGAAIAAQALSGVYGAMNFAVGLAVLVPALVVATATRKPLRLLAPLALGALAAAIMALPYAVPYARAAELGGSRSIGEILHYGATPLNYLAAPAANRLYGWTAARFGAEELYLFPGLGAVGLALVALIRPSRIALAYLVLLIVAWDATRGFDGWVYPALYRLVPPMRALRVPSRFDLIVNLALGVLAAIGLHRLRERFAERRAAIGVALIAVLAVEYASSPALVAAARPSLADRWFATQPPGVLAELPMPRLDAMWPNSESRFMYEGTAHWLPMVNGYSGFFPPSYLELLSVMESFPDARSIQYLRDRGVRYLLIRGTFFDDAEIARLRDGLGRAAGVSLVAVFPPPGRELVFTIDR